MKILEIFFTSFQTNILQDPKVTYVQICFKKNHSILVLEMADFGMFLQKTCLGPLGDYCS